MAILQMNIETKILESDYEKRKADEIALLICTLETGKEALVEIECAISAYRQSCYHYLKKYKEEAGVDIKFGFKQTKIANQWIIKRLK